MTMSDVQEERRLLAKAILEVSDDSREERVTRYLLLRLAEVLKVEPETIDADISVAELSISSVILAQQIREIEAELKIHIYAPDVFEAPSIAVLAEYVTELVEEAEYDTAL